MFRFGLAEAKPWGYIGDIGAAISEHAAKNGYTVVQNIGGHGVGVEFRPKNLMLVMLEFVEQIA